MTDASLEDLRVRALDGDRAALSTLSAALAALAVTSSGCSLFRKSQKPRESTAISSEVEATFRQRWMDKRLAELKAQGVADAAAQTQAAQHHPQKRLCRMWRRWRWWCCQGRSSCTGPQARRAA